MNFCSNTAVPPPSPGSCPVGFETPEYNCEYNIARCEACIFKMKTLSLLECILEDLSKVSRACLLTGPDVLFCDLAIPGIDALCKTPLLGACPPDTGYIYGKIYEILNRKSFKDTSITPPTYPSWPLDFTATIIIKSSNDNFINNITIYQSATLQKLMLYNSDGTITYQSCFDNGGTRYVIPTNISNCLFVFGDSSCSIPTDALGALIGINLGAVQLNYIGTTNITTNIWSISVNNPEMWSSLNITNVPITLTYIEDSISRIPLQIIVTQLNLTVQYIITSFNSLNTTSLINNTYFNLPNYITICQPAPGVNYTVPQTPTPTSFPTITPSQPPTPTLFPTITPSPSAPPTYTLIPPTIPIITPTPKNSVQYLYINKIVTILLTILYIINFIA